MSDIGEVRSQVLNHVEEIDSQVAAVMGLVDGENGIKEHALEVGAAVMGTDREDVRTAGEGLMDASDVVLDAVAALQTYVTALRGYAEAL
ncbi:MAG TPA: hypothetical protein VLH86_05935 [Patescibacteria group bacterium]|nr:hypothetical protein [Patescibacteria group bacterium]